MVALVGTEVAVPDPDTVTVRGMSTAAAGVPAACEPSGRATPAMAAAARRRRATTARRFTWEPPKVGVPDLRRRDAGPSHSRSGRCRDEPRAVDLRDRC